MPEGIIGRHAVAGYFCENARASLARGVEIFQGKNRCAFAQNHARAMSIKRTAFFWRRRLKRIKPNEDQFRKRVIPAGQHAFVAAGSQALKRVTDRVRAGSAGIRNYLAWRGDFEGFLGIDHRLLRRIIRDPGRRISQAAVSM